ncbi:MAG TPA: carbamoyltransferase N-terminal domain-containing protein [Myxococcales bacterium]|jgi:carbamoyltransferase|nr:carbamoyltransferase N-terminal domain-containing protein [Myxococcales bacterium]
MRILGLSAHYHDSAAALLVDGEPVCAVQEERLSRRKNDAAFPLAAVEWCLDKAGLQPEELDAVVFYEKPMLKFERILTLALRGFPRTLHSFPRAMKNALSEKLWVKGIIASQLGVPGRKILFTEHHQAHAGAAFFTAPTRAAAILTADGVGEWATLSMGTGRIESDGKASLRLLREIRFPHSLGMLYSTFTAWLGFPVNEGEYKVMGLAAYGKPAFADEVRKVLRRTPDGGIALDLSYFDYHLSARSSYSRKFLDVFGPARDAWDPIDLRDPQGQNYADVAASVQRVLEDTLVDLARALQRETGLTDLCLGGGVALNGCANARILREAGFARVFVPPAPGDAGCALGAALVVDRLHFGRPHHQPSDHPFWGPAADPEDLARVAAEDGMPLERIGDDRAVIARVAAELCEGKIAGWLDGACEWGPRALGHRSILAAPRDAAMRDKLNRSIKFREEFRPFAPAVPLEAASRYFDLPPGGDRLCRFMSGVFPVRPEFRERLAAVTHVDGTARVQTVERAMVPRFHALLEEVGRKSGIPVLLNTSFNLAGEPIVASAVEGYSTFRRSGLDLIACGPVVVGKPRAAAARPQEDVA